MNDDKKIYKFKSFKKILDVPVRTNVKLFQFTGSTYIIVEQLNLHLKIKLYQSFGDDISERCEFDLSFPEDSVTTGGNRDNETLCVLMVEKISNERDKKFFDELFACNLSDETISEVLLVSIDEKVFWIKFCESAIDGYSVENLTVAKAKILGLHYHKGILMVIDELSILSIFFVCSVKKLIRKKEILLQQVKCFRFYGNKFIYSTAAKITCLDLSDPTKPSESSANIKNISCFTIVEHLKFIIAICRNNFLYYISLVQKSEITSKISSFIDIPDNDFEIIPEVSKFYEIEEKNLLKVEKQIKDAMKMKLFLERLQCGDFIAGEATIKFQEYLIEFEIKFHEILNGLGLIVTFLKRNNKFTSIKRHKIDDSRTNEKISLPEQNDAHDEKCDMSLSVSLNLEINNRTCPLTYPINISSIIRSNDRNPKLQDDLERCKEIVKRLKT